MTKAMFVVDPKIAQFEAEVYNTPLIKDVWRDKYLQSGENHPHIAYRRVAHAIANSPCEKDPKEAERLFYEIMEKRLFLPGGRILAGAGTGKLVTLMNCYVNSQVQDTMAGIAEAKRVLLMTSKMGGGLGTDISPLRPSGAILRKTGSIASGPLPVISSMSADGKMIRSAGERRAAQMITMSDTHPDLPGFITTKGEGLKSGTKEWSEMNVSVLVSDAFKAAVDDDEEWPLYFHIPPASRDKALEERDFEDDDGVMQYVYSVWKARDLWELITKYTYEFSDPGVIFIDRVNELNNLSYCETIRCTNPCGEQPLPPDATCNLGAINIANCVKNPFTVHAEVDWDLVAAVAKVGVRFLDNVIEVTGYPLEAQKKEEYSKRRIGLGITGLGTLFAELQIPYGSHASVQIASQLMKCIALAAYDASIELASERGSFPLFQDQIVDCGFINQMLDDDRKELITEKGLRNGVVLTIAPVGTGSIALGNGSSGLEPDFALETIRNVRQNNTEEFKSYIEKGYTKRFYEFCTGQTDIPEYMVTAESLSILDHIKVQAALQKWVDASTSKTINVPQDIPYEKFVEVYELAYQYGLKGTTTYRHSKWRDSILRDASEKEIIDDAPAHQVTKRPDILKGTTYKLKWHSMSSSMFVTVNYLNGRPYEVFFASKDAKYQDWMTGLTLMMSNVFRHQNNPEGIIEELKQVVSTHDGQFLGGKYYGSLVARIGHIIEQDFILNGVISLEGQPIQVEPQQAQPQLQVEAPAELIHATTCPSCRVKAYIHKEGCKTCTNCGYSAC